MNFKSTEGFDDLHPRAAPAPESFRAVSVSSTVPEVSLVFSPSSVSVKQLVRKASLEDNAQNSLSKHINVTEKRLQDSTYKILQHERSEEKCRLSAMKSVSYNSHLPSSNIQLDHWNDKLRRNQDVDIRKIMPSNRSSGPNGMSNMTGLYESPEAKSYQPLTNRGTYTTKPMSPPAFQSNSKCTTNFRGRLLKTSDLNSHGDMIHISEIPAHCCLENGMNISQTLERRPNESTQNRPVGFSCDCCSCDKHQYCINQSSCVFAQDMITNNGSSSMAHVPNFITRSNASNCVPRVSYIETRENFCNKNVNGHSRKCVNRCVDVSSKSSEYNARLYDNERFERKIDSEEKKISLNRTPVMKQYELSAHKYNKNLETNVNNSENITVYKTGDVSHASTLNSSAEIHRQDTESKKNCVSPLRASSESKGKKNDGRNSDTSILQEIALMNQKQCSILQGLLQQVVVMQADQMKILSEINEKLSNARVPEDSISKKPENNCTTSSVVPKMENVTTQTSVNERPCFCCQNCDGISEKVPSSNVQSLSKNIPINSSYKTNVHASPQNHDGQEKDQNKIKKLQDRAVSWSAVRGVETVEESFTLHGVCVPTVVDQLPSSVHTMHLHVQDYHSSASFDSNVESKNETDSNCGENGQDNPKGSWTLYDNIVGHVKKFLQSVPCEKSGSTPQKTSQVEAIRFATIEKIRQLGVSVYENSAEIKDLNAAGRIHFDSNVASRFSFKDPTVAEESSCDASLELQTLALKYLQDDDICDVVRRNQNGKTSGILKTGQKSANISLATQQYLEKYHLLPLGTDCKDRRHINASCGQIHVEDNILDITTLKRQPKLL